MQANTGSSLYTANTVYRAAVSWNTNSFRIAVNGTEYTEDVSGTVPTGLSQIDFGREGASVYLNGHIRNVTYFPYQLSQAELNTRSTL